MDNIVIYRGQPFLPYSVQKDVEIFDPSDFGMQPAWPCDACWDGFLVKLEITYDMLYLTELGVNLEDVNNEPLRGPVLHDVEPVFRQNPGDEGDLAELFNNYYKLRMPLSFCGQLLLGDAASGDLTSILFDRSSVCGDAFVREYEEKIGPPWCYQHKTLYRLTFEHGKLLLEEDISKLNRRYRELVEKEHDKQNRELEEERGSQSNFMDDEPPF